MTAPDTLLIDEGDLASLTLLALQPDPSRLVVWHSRTLRARLAAAQAHAEICGKGRLIVADPPPPPAPDMQMREHIAQAESLLRAAALATHLRCGRVLCPAVVGPHHVRIAEALERDAAVAQLVDPSGALLIDAPIIDLSDAQLVELADEAGAPLRAFWPCVHDRDDPCGSCAGCVRWRSAFSAAGIEWPWASVESPAAHTTGT